jgi:hypothetical protein
MSELEDIFETRPSGGEMNTKTMPEPLLESAPPPPWPPRIRLLPVATGLWRVVDGDGRALGHLRRLVEPEGERLRALRFHAATRTFRDVGDFWTTQDAVDALRYSA